MGRFKKIIFFSSFSFYLFGPVVKIRLVRLNKDRGKARRVYLPNQKLKTEWVANIQTLKRQLV
jgi:hypothetical protein